MEMRMFGRLWPVSSLTIGGGGIGQVWGPTSREESVDTLRAAIDGGITLIDVAPSYGDGEAEKVVGEAFDGNLADDIRVCTKFHAPVDPGDVESTMVDSLDESLERMRLDYVDVFILHSQILPALDQERSAWTTYLDLYEQAVMPAFESLVEKGRIGAWGITAVQFPELLARIFAGDPAPQVAQMVANVLDSPGDMKWTGGATDFRALIAQAKDHDIGVMGIRAVQAGALTDGLDRSLDEDHPAMVDFERAAPFRALAAELGESTAVLAHRYVLSMDGVDTVVLGVKNREELADCLRAAEQGPLPDELMNRVEDLMLPVRGGVES